MVEYETVVQEYESEKPLSSLDMTRDGKRYLVSGREVIRVLLRTRNEFAVESNVRPARGGMDVTTVDAKFCPSSEQGATVASASANGAVLLWRQDGRGWRRLATYREHLRTVHRVAWHPSHDSLLASASQDASVRFWDIRAPADSGAFAKLDTHAPARDVCYEPRGAQSVAVGLDDGRVLTWDVTAGKLRSDVSGHHGPVLALAWHLSADRVLASAGRDRSVVVWDTASAAKALQTATVATSVGALAWRPGFPAHLVTCPHIMDPQVYVWNLRRPSIPVYVLPGQRDVASAALWTAQGRELVTCGKDGRVRVHRVDLAEPRWEHVRSSTCAWSPTGTLVTAREWIVRSALVSCDPAAPDRAAEAAAAYALAASVDPPSAHTLRENYPYPLHFADSPWMEVASAANLSSSTSTMSLPPPSSSTLASSTHSLPSLHGSTATGPSSATPQIGLPPVSTQSGLPNPSSSSSSTTSTPPLTSSTTSLRHSSKRVESPLAATNAMASPTAFLPLAYLQPAGGGLPRNLVIHPPVDSEDASFRALAEAYVLDSEQLDAACASNARAAEAAHCPQAAAVWRMVGSLVAPLEDPGPPAQPPSSLARARTSHAYASQNSLPSLSAWHTAADEADEEEDDKRLLLRPRSSALDLEAFRPVHRLGAGHRPVLPWKPQQELVLGGDDSILLPAPLAEEIPPVHSSHLPEEAVEVGEEAEEEEEGAEERKPADASTALEDRTSPKLLDHVEEAISELLEWHANQGDVQFCVTLSMVLGARHSEYRSNRFLHWYVAYHERLLRLRMYTTATRLLKRCPLDQVRAINQKSTTMYSSCAKCGKPLERPGMCEKCRRMPNTCAICHEIVRGLYVWCQGCGHGGHLLHLRNWFSSHSTCPGACGHKCNLISNE